MRTVGEVAQILSRHTGDPADSIARAIRGWVQTGVLVPTARQARGVTGTIIVSLFDEVSVCSIRLMMLHPFMVTREDLQFVIEETRKGVFWMVECPRHLIFDHMPIWRKEDDICETDWATVEIVFQIPVSRIILPLLGM